MNEETSLPTETGDSIPAESSALEVEATDPASVFETVDSSLGLEPYFTQTQSEDQTATDPVETTPVYVPEETVAETVAPVTVEVIQDGFWSLIHADLFGSFLICGTLIGCTLMRKIYGT